MSESIVTRIWRLLDDEVALRQRARAVELDPTRREEAVGLFEGASALREERLRLARQCGLV